MRAVAVAAVVIVLAAGCASGTKSGGTSSHEIRIVMQTPDAPEADAEYFIRQVHRRSGERIQIVEGTGYSSNDSGNEARLVRALRNGKVDMAYIPSRDWERASSVTAFRALQAPLLITNYPLLRRITTGPMGRSMLTSLNSIGVVGLGLVPDELRRLLGGKPLVSAGALRGARIRVIASPTSVLALRALGAVPLTSFTSHQVGPALQQGRLDGAETATSSILNNGYIRDARYLSANVALFAKTQTIAIRKSVLDRLSAGDRAVLRAAALATVIHADPAAQERNDVAGLCSGGLRLARASASDLAALRREGARAYAILQRDPMTREEIRAILRVRTELAGTPPALSCPSSQGGHQVRPKSSALSGTYTMSSTLAEEASAPAYVVGDNWGSFRLVLHDGQFRLSDHRPGGALVQGHSNGHSSGTYAVHGNRIVFMTTQGIGDTPLGTTGDAPVVCRWSLYRNRLSFRQLSVNGQAAARVDGLDPGGPSALYVKPWSRVS